MAKTPRTKSCLNCTRTMTGYCAACIDYGNWKGTLPPPGEHNPGCACKECLTIPELKAEAVAVPDPAGGLPRLEVVTVRRASPEVLRQEGHALGCASLKGGMRGDCNCAAGTPEQRSRAYTPTVTLPLPPAPASRNDLALPTGDQERKDAPIYRGVLNYFPRALAAVAALSKQANDKHNPGQPMHWSQDRSTDHGDCILRHQADAGTIDISGVPHSVNVAWRALAQLEVELQVREGKADCPHPNVRWDVDAGEPVCLLCGFGLRSGAHRT